VVGIVAYGAYVPRLRLSRAAVVQANQWFAPGLKAHAKGERAMANWDEDVITMAVEAARDALPGPARGRPDAVILASTSAPFADRQNAGVVKEALNLPDDVLTQDVGGSQKAGTGALLQALHACAGGGGTTLCIAAERSRARAGSEAELVNGDAAAAFVIGTQNPIARLVGSHSLSLDFVDHFRGRDADYDYAWEARWTRDEGFVAIANQAVRAALDKLGLRGEDIARLLVAIPASGVAEAVAKAARIPPAAIAPGLGLVMGHAGAAQPLVMLAQAMKTARPGERLLLVGFGQGCDVLVFEVTEAITAHAHPLGVDGWLARRKPETNYLKHLFFAGELDLERGMRAEMEQKQPLTALYRNRKTVLGLVGARSARTGEVQFPRSTIGVGATDAAGDDTFEDYPFADRPARVLTFTADHLTYTPDPPSYYGMVEFDGGGRMLAEFTDVDPGSVEVGLAMRMSFRIKAVDEKRAFTKYFWKAVPAFR
jgi:hydroxymethylglutaryl-CoA synthase